MIDWIILKYYVLLCELFYIYVVELILFTLKFMPKHSWNKGLMNQDVNIRSG